MAVAQGYGKTVTSGSVFAYDTGDTRNSYIGEPTINYITTMAANIGGNVSLSYPNNVYICTAQETNVIDTTAPGGQYSRFTGNTDSDNNQLFTSFVDGGVNARNTTVSYSVFLKGTGTCHLTVYSDIAGYNITPTITLNSEWTRYSIVQFVGNYTTHAWAAVRGILTSTNVYVAAQQIEFNTHVTPFINGTRSSTQGLLPIVGNSTIDLSNVSFDSNAQMTFDGTDDYTVIGTVGITDYSQPFTMECIFKVDSAATWDNGFLSNIYGIAGSYAGMYGLFKNSNNAVGLQLRDATTTSYATATGLSKGSYYHLVGTWNGSNTMVLYVNGVVTQTTSTTKTGATDSSNLYIGGVRAYGGAAGNYYQGEIPIVKYYNRALTAAEINQNYLHYKTRFNLS
jgi:hypothetical protein